MSAALLQDVVAELRYLDWQFRVDAGATSTAGDAELSMTQAMSGYSTSPGTGRTIVMTGVPVRLMISLRVPDSNNGLLVRITHPFGYPGDRVLSGDRPAVERWVFDRIMDVHRHEAMENFRVGEHRPFYPEHGPGARLYEVLAR